MPRPVPNPDEYAEALTERANVKDKTLQQLEIELDGRRDMPLARRGRSGAVFHFRGPSARALKVFTVDRQELKDRHAHISTYLEQISSDDTSCLVGLRYFAEGVFVQGDWYPSVTMDWCVGQSLDVYVGRLCESRKRIDNAQLVESWIDVLNVLRRTRVLHGDLQHGNVIVDEGRYQLVDYDGMLVPSMVGRFDTIERGHVDYQHPDRILDNHGELDDSVEDFSALVILVSLLTVTRDLWRTYAGTGDGLLIHDSDLTNPTESQLFRTLRARRGEEADVVALLCEAIERLEHSTDALQEAAALTGIELVPRDLDEPEAQVVPPAPVDESGEVERAVVTGIADGLSNEAIADRLGRPEAFVRSVVSNLQVRYGAPTRGAIPAAAEARSSGPPSAGPEPRRGRRRETPDRSSPVDEAVRRAEVRPEANDATARPPTLSPRQIDVLERLQAGDDYTAAAAALGITPRTVADHAAAVRRRLDVRTDREAVSAAQVLGALEPPRPKRRPSGTKAPQPRKRASQRQGGTPEPATPPPPIPPAPLAPPSTVGRVPAPPGRPVRVGPPPQPPSRRTTRSESLESFAVATAAVAALIVVVLFLLTRFVL